MIFTRWDHLQRDQQADADVDGDGLRHVRLRRRESANAARLNQRVEVFPEPRSSRTDLLAGTNLEGTEHQPLLPVGDQRRRHRGGDAQSHRPSRAARLLQPQHQRRRTRHRVHRRRPQRPDEPERDPESLPAPRGSDARRAATSAPTRRSSRRTPRDRSSASSRSRRARGSDPGHVRHRTLDARCTRGDAGGGSQRPLSRSAAAVGRDAARGPHRRDARGPQRRHARATTSRYAFRIKTLAQQNGTYVAGDAAHVRASRPRSRYWDPDVLVSWSGTLWELNPVEVRARPRPRPACVAARGARGADLPRRRRRSGALPQRPRRAQPRPRRQPQRHRARRRRQAAAVQPARGTPAASSDDRATANGKIYDVALLQFFQADQLRGIGGTASPRAGRRVLARAMHDPAVKNPPTPTRPPEA